MQRSPTPDHEHAAVVETALDYFEGWFTADAERMRRALHPRLAKRALVDDDQALDEDTAAQMITATAAGLGQRDTPVEVAVEVVEVYDRIATVVVRSSVYREYLHLVRTPDGWKIVNALYQPV